MTEEVVYQPKKLADWARADREKRRYYELTWGNEQYLGKVTLDYQFRQLKDQFTEYLNSRTHLETLNIKLEASGKGQILVTRFREWLDEQGFDTFAKPSLLNPGFMLFSITF